MRVSTALMLLAAGVAVVLPGALAFVPAAMGSPSRVQQQVRTSPCRLNRSRIDQ